MTFNTQILLLCAAASALACSSGDGAAERDSGAVPTPQDAGSTMDGATARDASPGPENMDGNVALPDGGQPLVDAGPDEPDASLASLCIQTGGSLELTLCCMGKSDFPNTCLIGGCACSPSASAQIRTCSCAQGCFSPESGCTDP